MLLMLLSVLLTLVIILWLVAVLVFDSKDHREYDSPRPASAVAHDHESTEHKAAVRDITAGLAAPPPAAGKELLSIMRKQMDERGEATRIVVEVRPVDAGGVDAEWVIAANASPGRRLLYIHGGAYVMGSARSHRPITSRLSEISSSAVLSVNYRLMPENSRMAGIEDCRIAYAWVLENGPDAPGAAETLIVAGDSSGGNLALTTVAWARDSGLPAASAVVALSPQTDATLASPSLRGNTDTDVMQGKSFGPVVRAPRAISLWLMFLMHRANPSDPQISPLLGDLSNLPPTLLQASEAEMFLDDAVRYANKATSHGSHAVLQTWPSAMHVWHAFDVPEADEAFLEIERFLSAHAARTPPVTSVAPDERVEPHP